MSQTQKINQPIEKIVQSIEKCYFAKLKKYKKTHGI